MLSQRNYLSQLLRPMFHTIYTWWSDVALYLVLKAHRRLEFFVVFSFFFFSFFVCSVDP